MANENNEHPRNLEAENELEIKEVEGGTNCKINNRATIIKDGREEKQNKVLKPNNEELGDVLNNEDEIIEEQNDNILTSNHNPEETSTTKVKQLKKRGRQNKKLDKNSIAQDEILTPVAHVREDITKSIVTSTSGGINSGTLRVISGGGLKAPSLPIVLNMSRSSTSGGISLLPPGLPPGRYVILPSSTSSIPSVTSISASSVQSSLKTGPTAVITGNMKAVSTTQLNQTISPPVVQKANYFSGRIGRPAKIAIQRTSSQRRGSCHFSHNKPVRSRRKSYTAAEKLAMIEAVEAGEKKSVVADHFGVAPSTLACILLQKYKIRCDQASDLSRKRLRHPRTSALSLTQSSEVNHQGKEAKDNKYKGLSFGAHFLSSLSTSEQNLFDEELLEEIISASDLNERLSLDNPLNPMKHESPKISVSYNCPSMPIDGSNLAGSSFDFPDHNKEIFSDQDNNHIDVKSEPHFEVHEELLDENALSNVGVSSPNSSPSSRQTSPSPPGITAPYLLKKETHCHNILDELLKDETYADVTLTAEGKTIKAHRIILSLSSKYFRTVLSQEPNAKNVILFRDMKFQELRDIINFIYTGEVTVDASDLDSFMKTADVLEVTSLCNSHKNFPKEFNLGSTNSAPTQSSSKRTHSESTLPPPKVRKTSNDGAKSSKRSYSSINECTEPTTSVSLNIKEEETEEMPELAHIEAECLLSVPSSDTPQKSCVCCPSTFENVDLMFQHIDDAHEKEEMFPCEVCVQIFSTSKLFNKHLKLCAPKSDQ